MDKTSYFIDNGQHIGLRLVQSRTTTTDSTGTHPGDDALLLMVENAEKYDTDLISGGNLHLHFTPAQARRLARLLWQMAQRCRKAEDYKDISDIPDGIVVPDQLLRNLK